MMSNLLLNTDNTQSVSVIKANGRVDSDTAPELDVALAKLLADGRSKIILDLQGVDYLSSAGLRVMVKGLKGAQGLGGDVRLASVSKPIETILRTVGMMQMFKLFPTNEEAAAGF